ncbi:hypothetical protein BKA67DRAFT_593227 [Truncatella angustata]|uniref:Uncharacterized protein n=1 Tax=Truncatella angustata TaxID=152316 RepID=A0A9P8ZWQ0_9PEZI|nr:uncharacterized protein BKA67DRAFT_593227 [Truncatella angustata]KAH6653251.1 hypothetical protein BKA67DRAFT_593227 [Truncatella angustata]
MVSTNPSSGKARSEPITAGRFQFISVQAPDDAKDPATRRLARSHAVKQALEKKRKLQQESTDNFRVIGLRDKPRRSASKRPRTGTFGASPFSLSADLLDPFQTLAVDSSRLQALLSNYKARLAPEPVFSVCEELAFQNFRSVFRTGLVDPALLNAVMLSLAVAVTGGSIDRECLGYQGQAISYIRERMSSLDEATSESTIGAILLLAGVEARLGVTSQVQLHMGAVQLLLNICLKKGICLTGGIKRAIFWQDLNSSILAGSSRIVEHTTFVELQWTRDPFSPSFFRLAPGFQARSNLLTKNFIEILEDIQALRCIRDLPCFVRWDVVRMASINNHTASIQSRLVGLPKPSPILESCHLAAYLCSVMLCCTVWCALVIPSHISSQLLRVLQHANGDPIWDGHSDLLLWLLYMGGAFAPQGPVRSGYILLLRSNGTVKLRGLYTSWGELLQILKQFIWSDKAFKSHVKAFWAEVFT